MSREDVVSDGVNVLEMPMMRIAELQIVVKIIKT